MYWRYFLPYVNADVDNTIKGNPTVPLASVVPPMTAITKKQHPKIIDDVYNHVLKPYR